MPPGTVTSRSNSTANALINLMLSIVFCAAGAQVSAQIEVLDQVVAIVDDDIVLASELEERVIGIKSSLEARGVDVPTDDVLIRETLDRLILDSIQLQLASRYGVKIPDQQLDQSMTRLAQQKRTDTRSVPTGLRTIGTELCGDPRKLTR